MECNAARLAAPSVTTGMKALKLTKCLTTGWRHWSCLTYHYVSPTGMTGKRHIPRNVSRCLSSFTSIFRTVCVCTFFFRCVIFLTCFCAPCIYRHLFFCFPSEARSQKQSEKSGCWPCASVHMERFCSYWVDFREITVREKRLLVMCFRSIGAFLFLLGGFS